MKTTLEITEEDIQNKTHVENLLRQGRMIDLNESYESMCERVFDTLIEVEDKNSGESFKNILIIPIDNNCGHRQGK